MPRLFSGPPPPPISGHSRAAPCQVSWNGRPGEQYGVTSILAIEQTGLALGVQDGSEEVEESGARHIGGGERAEELVGGREESRAVGRRPGCVAQGRRQGRNSPVR
jgi:hypothetical protein